MKTRSLWTILGCILVLALIIGFFPNRAKAAEDHAAIWAGQMVALSEGTAHMKLCSEKYNFVRMKTADEEAEDILEVSTIISAQSGVPRSHLIRLIIDGARDIYKEIASSPSFTVCKTYSKEHPEFLSMPRT
jgi:hypothetical protein